MNFIHAFIGSLPGNFDLCERSLLLRALHYAGAFRHAGICRIDFPRPAADADGWSGIVKSLSMRKVSMKLEFSDSPDFSEFKRRLRFTPKPFCAPLYPFYLTDENGRLIEEIHLKLPDIPALTDFHVHTPFAYCCENVTVPAAIAVARASNLKFLHFSEHSGHLYFNKQDYYSGGYDWNARRREDCRFAEYLALSREYAGERPFVEFCLEIDGGANGVPIVEPGVIPLNGARIGAVHHISATGTYEEKKRDFIRRVSGLIDAKIDILAHPFRVFSWGNMPIPTDLFDELSTMLAEAKVAAEINFHVNTPQAEFVELCLKKGVKLSLGSDSHNLYEVGFLLPHLDFLRELGCAGKLDRILISMEDIRKKAQQ